MLFRASVVPNAVQEMSEQFVLIQFYIFTLFARYNGNGMHFLKKKKIISNTWNKIHLTVHVDYKYTCAKSIFIDCNKAIASKFDIQTYTQVCVVANKSQQRTLSCQNCNLLFCHF